MFGIFRSQKFKEPSSEICIEEDSLLQSFRDHGFMVEKKFPSLNDSKFWIIRW